jgi:hypothetical protein
MTIAVFIPAYNCAEWAATVPLPVGLRYFAVDNASTDATASILTERGVTVFRNTENLGRIGNWERCLTLFQNETDATWMQWLFAGDRLHPDAPEILKAAIAAEPTARLMICQYDEVDGARRSRNALFPAHRLVQPHDSLRTAAALGNWFGSPIGHCFHREAAAIALPAGDWPWVADMMLCLRAARRFPVAYRAASIGEFCMENRKYFKAFANSLESVYEEGLIRMTAARWSLEDTGDTDGFQRLQDGIRRDSMRLLIRRGLQQPSPERLLRRIAQDAMLLKSYARIVKRKLRR